MYNPFVVARLRPPLALALACFFDCQTTDRYVEPSARACLRESLLGGKPYSVRGVSLVRGPAKTLGFFQPVREGQQRLIIEFKSHLPNREAVHVGMVSRVQVLLACGTRSLVC
jgi:hypothetical protein